MDLQSLIDSYAYAVSNHGEDSAPAKLLAALIREAHS